MDAKLMNLDVQLEFMALGALTAAGASRENQWDHADALQVATSLRDETGMAAENVDLKAVMDALVQRGVVQISGEVSALGRGEIKVGFITHKTPSICVHGPGWETHLFMANLSGAYGGNAGVDQARYDAGKLVTAWKLLPSLSDALVAEADRRGWDDLEHQPGGAALMNAIGECARVLDLKQYPKKA